MEQMTRPGNRAGNRALTRMPAFLRIQLQWEWQCGGAIENKRVKLKERIMKKGCALLLAVLMLLTQIPFSAFAEELKTPADEKQTREAAGEAEKEEEKEPVVYPDELIVGHPTATTW